MAKPPSGGEILLLRFAPVPDYHLHLPATTDVDASLALQTGSIDRHVGVERLVRILAQYNCVIIDVHADLARSTDDFPHVGRVLHLDDRDLLQARPL